MTFDAFQVKFKYTVTWSDRYAVHPCTINLYTGKGSYSFGDVSIELNKRRAEWVTGYLGEDPHPHPHPNPNQAS